MVFFKLSTLLVLVCLIVLSIIKKSVLKYLPIVCTLSISLFKSVIFDS